MALKNLCDAGIVDPYPPLCDIKGSYTAQVRAGGRPAAVGPGPGRHACKRCAVLRRRYI